ncbi:LPS-assembly protein LptD [Desulforapulum autotrophicum]|nr:LPS assembly protein LptD [Desulforapulum autotrophicum]
MLLILLLLALPATAKALMDKQDQPVAWHISAAKGTHDYERGLYIADGEVVIKGGTTRLEADHLEFNSATNDAMARGHVLLISGEDTVTCEALTINLTTETGTIYDGTIFVQENNFYIRGQKITKTGKDSYLAQQASLTSCNTETPDWKITAKNVRVTIGGYGVAKHATLYARNIPALYTPFLGFPAKTRRQTGLLTPEYSLSDRKGFELNLPLFLAINRASDATLYADYMEKRGTKLGLEYRYILGSQSKGTLFFDYLDDQKIDDGTDATSDYSYSTTPDRTNTDRYWFRMKHDQALPMGWKAKLDLDVVSDADYLHEFKDGYTGFTNTQNTFADNFGRNLDDYDDTTRTNQLNLNRTWDTYSLNVDVDWYDDVEARQLNEDDTTLQTLPAVTLNTVYQRINRSDVYFDLDAGYKNFFRQDTTSALVNGQRADIHPSLYYPIKAGRYLNVEPSVGLRQTAWYSDDYTLSGEDESSGGFSHRELVDLNLEMSTRFSRIFTPGNDFAERIKHEIVPALEYNYIPDVDQDDLPFFDDEDRVARQNQVTWSVTNRFTTRKIKPVPLDRKTSVTSIADTPVNATPKTPETQVVYHEFAWVKLYQTYYFDDLTYYDDDDDDDDVTRYDIDKSFSDLSLESEFSPYNWLSLEMDVDWSAQDNQFTMCNTGFTLKDNRKDTVQFRYRYQSEESELVDVDPSETLYVKTNVVITPSLNAFISHEEDLYNNERVETSTGIGYHRQCWSMVLTYRDQPDDRSVGFFINLYGIGEFGQE